MNNFATYLRDVNIAEETMLPLYIRQVCLLHGSKILKT